MQAKVLEYWSPAPLPEGDPGKDASAPAELRQQVDKEIEFSSDSSVGASRRWRSPEPQGRREEDPAIEGGVDGGTTVTEELDPQGDEQGPGSVGAPGHCCDGVSIGRPQAKKEAAQGLGQLRGEVTPLGTSSGA